MNITTNYADVPNIKNNNIMNKVSEVNSSVLFSEKLKNINKSTYIDQIKEYTPGSSVTVKSMNAEDIKKYYEEWKKQPVDYNGLKPSITVSPKVIERMNGDPEYAEKMLLKIKTASIPMGFEHAKLYEYKVFVRDDGEIETMSCADFMNGNSKKTDEVEDNQKEKEKKVKLTRLHKKLSNPINTQIISKDEVISNMLYGNIGLMIAEERPGRKRWLY